MGPIAFEDDDLDLVDEPRGLELEDDLKDVEDDDDEPEHVAMRDAAAAESDDENKEAADHLDLDRRGRFLRYFRGYRRAQRWARNTRLGKWYANSPNAQRAVSLGLLAASFSNPLSAAR